MGVPAPGVPPGEPLGGCIAAVIAGLNLMVPGKRTYKAGKCCIGVAIGRTNKRVVAWWCTILVEIADWRTTIGFATGCVTGCTIEDSVTGASAVVTIVGSGRGQSNDREIGEFSVGGNVNTNGFVAGRSRKTGGSAAEGS